VCSDDDTTANHAWLDTVDFFRRIDDILRLDKGLCRYFIGPARAWADGVRGSISLSLAFARLLVAGPKRKDRLGQRGSDRFGNWVDRTGDLSTGFSCCLRGGYFLNGFARLAARHTLDVRCRAKYKFGGTMNRLKLLRRGQNTLLILWCAQFFLPVYAQGQKLDSLTAVAEGYGVIADRFEERKFTGALVVLRQDGTALITLYSDLQLQAQGTWSNDSSPEEILLKITGGELGGNVIGTGKLLLSQDRKSIRELTLKGKSFDGREIAVTFVAAASESSPIEHVNLVSVGP